MKDKNNTYTKKVKNWNELVSEINNFLNFPQYIYRGQAESTWLLESTLSRALKNIKNKNKAKDELVNEHFERFILSIRGRRGPNPIKLSENEVWSLGQHFGLYTPLLDWSKSPYVALFFALSNPLKSKSGYRTLWVLNSLDIDKINSFYKTKYSNEKNIVELINPITDENNRLVNQNGLFTKIDINTDIENWVIESEVNINWLTLSKIDFPENIRNEALLHLDLMNINYSSLFPELYGSSLDTNIRLEQTDYITKQQNEVWKKHSLSL